MLFTNQTDCVQKDKKIKYDFISALSSKFYTAFFSLKPRNRKGPEEEPKVPEKKQGTIIFTFDSTCKPYDI